VKLLNGDVVPPAAVAVTVLAPVSAPGAMASAAVALVEDQDEIVAVSPVPLNVMAVKPVRFWPKMVKWTLVLAFP